MSLDTSLLFPLMYMVDMIQNGTKKQAGDDTRVTVHNLARNGVAP